MKYITFTNNGSIRLCENFLLSTRSVGIEEDIVVYCLDEESYNRVRDNYKCEVKFFDIGVEKTFHEYGRNQFRRITEAKVQIILRELQDDDSLVYTDCDVVFREDPSEFILDVDREIKENNKDIDIYFASDEPFMHICTGFMYLKNRENVHELFKKFFELSTFYGRTGSDCMYDQEITNQILKENSLKNNITWATYPTTFVKNGHLYWNESHSRTGSEVVVHVNFTIGEENKINRLREANLWYIQEEVIT